MKEEHVAVIAQEAADRVLEVVLIDEKTVELVTWQNALDAYSQSGQIDVEALLATPVIDQSQLFSDNSVLRGQPPRIDAVPN